MKVTLSLLLVFLSGCSFKIGKHKTDDSIFKYNKGYVEVQKDNLIPLNFEPQNFEKPTKIKTKTLILEEENKLIRKDSFDINGQIVYSISRAGTRVEKKTYNRWGLRDTVYRLEKDSSLNNTWSVSEICEYYMKGKEVFRFTYLVKDNKKSDTYFHVQQFIYKDLLLSNTYHWNTGGRGQQERYFYSPVEAGRIDSIQSYRGNMHVYSLLYSRSKTDTGFIEVVISSDRDTSSVNYFSPSNQLMRYIDYSKPNPYQKYSDQYPFRLEYEYY